MNSYNRFNIILGWLTFVISLVTYTLTLEPTVSFWDCGEFISASYRLQICHPPGAPLFLMIGRIFSLFAGSDVTKIAFCVNMVSAITSALCVMFFFWTITHLAKKILSNDSDPAAGQMISIFGAGLVGALTLNFSDTFWFSAVEAEVYASSSFFTTLTFWCILKWENIANEKHADRWLILIAYLIGLAIGVHLLNLLVIPAIVYVYYFKKYTYTRNGFLKASGVAILAIGIVQFGIIPGLPLLATKFDYMFVNGFGMPFNSGALFLIALLIGVLTWAIIYTTKKGKVFWNTIVLATAFIIIGYSSYAMIVIRSLANPAIDMNDPEQPFALLSYLNREQYGENPLLYGQYFYARVIDVEKKGMQYRKGKDTYEEAGEKLERVYDPKDCTILPRMWADRADYQQSYRQWENMPGEKKATFSKNIDFLLSYQLGFMYWRYFFWNFVGRQNEDQGFGGPVSGNWISGISFIDNARLGPIDKAPPSIKNVKAHNTYFGLPLILGLLGMFYHYRKARKDMTVVMTLFLFTGFFIILYLNFPAHQPRERDYAYVGSYQTFMIWVGLGVLAIADYLQRKINGKTAAMAASAIGLVASPVILANQNWDDHDRSNRYTALHFAEDYLNSCDKDAILFTNGDNDTYPLWYAQNVENIRSDVRVINLSLLNTDWYADALKRPSYDSKPLDFSLTSDKYVQGTRDYVVFYENPTLEAKFGINKTGYYPLKNIMQFIADDNDPMATVESQGGERLHYYPTKRFSLLIDKEACLKNGVVQAKDAPLMLDSINWEIGNSTLMKADLILLDLVATNINKRPICWAITTGSDVYMNLQPFFQLQGLVYRLVPIKGVYNANDGTIGRINTDLLYTNLMTKFKWGNMEKPGINLDETIIRQTKNFKNIFYRLAEALSQEGKKDSAVKVLDRCREMLPASNVPHDVFSVRLIEGYYMAGATQKANQYLKEVFEYHFERGKYFAEFPKAKRKNVQADLDENMQICGYCVQVASINGQTAIANEIKAKFEALNGPMN